MPPLDELRVVGLFQLADGEPTGDPPRTWIQVMITGKFKHGKHGDFEITAGDLEGFAADIKERADQILIDFDHDSAYAARSTRAAGWYTGETEIKEDTHGRQALFAEVEFTPVGAAAVRSKEYRYISPEFSRTYRDATGKLVKKLRMWATALTNRPFLPDMEPVTLADVVWEAGEGWRQLEEKLRAALNPGPDMAMARFWVLDVAADKALVQEYAAGRTYVVPFTTEDGKVSIAEAGEWTEAQQEWVTAAVHALRDGGPRRPFIPTAVFAALGLDVDDTLALAVWSTAFVNDLPDGSFLHIRAGGEKDEDGKTTPRSLRMFPVKDADGKVDMPHLRNALARIPRSNLPDDVKTRLTAMARRMLDRADGGTRTTDPASGTTTNEGAEVNPEILALLGLPEHADDQTILAALKERETEVKTLQDQLKAAKADGESAKTLATRIAELEKDAREREVKLILDEEVRTFRVLPTEVEGFTEAFADNVEGLKRLLNTRPPRMFEHLAREHGHGGTAGDVDPEVRKVAADMKGSEPVDEDSAKLHLAAVAILKERGVPNWEKASPEEYSDALGEAQARLHATFA